MKYNDLFAEMLVMYKKNENRSITSIAKEIHKKYNLKVSEDNFRRAMSGRFYRSFKKGNKSVGVSNTTKTITKSNEYQNNQKFVISAWNKKGFLMDIDEYCEHYKIPREDITSYKLVTHTAVPYYNTVFKEKSGITQDLTADFIEEAIKKHLQPVKVPIYKGGESVHCLRVIYTDTHIAMETNANGFSLYGGVWNEDELENRRTEIINAIIDAYNTFGYFDEIHLIDLGDFADGWDALTVRGGHELPQNMDNQKAFDVGLSFKINLTKDIIALNYTSKIKLFNICNDNHAGAFGYVINSAAKQFLEAMFPGLITVENFRKFINHYFYGKHCFILTHGKDDKNKKFGFKPILDKEARLKIDEYIKIHKLLQKDCVITFEKGDSHQQLFDYCSSDDFDYMNYMALSPSSEWIQTNFKRGRSGFNLMIVNKNNKRKFVIPYEFEWQDKSA